MVLIVIVSHFYLPDMLEFVREIGFSGVTYFEKIGQLLNKAASSDIVKDLMFPILWNLCSTIKQYFKKDA